MSQHDLALDAEHQMPMHIATSAFVASCEDDGSALAADIAHALRKKLRKLDHPALPLRSAAHVETQASEFFLDLDRDDLGLAAEVDSLLQASAKPVDEFVPTITACDAAILLARFDAPRFFRKDSRVSVKQLSLVEKAHRLIVRLLSCVYYHLLAAFAAIQMLSWSDSLRQTASFYMDIPKKRNYGQWHI